jgi:hypothetical protein
MMHFIRNLIYYLSYEVMETQWQTFKKKLGTVKNFYEILELHDAFLHHCLNESLLMNYDLFKTLDRINQTCEVFCNIIEEFCNQLQVD